MLRAGESRLIRVPQVLAPRFLSPHLSKSAAPVRPWVIGNTTDLANPAPEARQSTQNREGITIMQYMALIYSDPAREPQYGGPGFHEMMAGYFAFTEKLTKDRKFGAGDALQGIDTATSLRVRDGKTETMDGPFAETKEVLGGYYLMECKDLDDALHYAAMIPSAQHGTIELRPVMVYG